MGAPPPDLQFMAALKANRSGDKVEARRILEAILAEEPDHADSLEVLGMLLSEAGELDAAITTTERVLKTRPESIMAHANISRFYMLKGDKETAEDWQSKARVLGWKDEIARKGEAGGEAGGLERGPDPDTVMKQEANVEAHPDDPRARLQLAGSYTKLGMPAKAVPHLQHALKVEAAMSILYLELGKALEEVGAKEQAAQIYDRGIPIADDNGDFMPRNQMQTRLAKLQRAAKKDGNG